MHLLVLLALFTKKTVGVYLQEHVCNMVILKEMCLLLIFTLELYY